MWKDAIWLGVPESEIKKWNILQGDMNGRFAYYRCEVELYKCARLQLSITANSRYRFWINGEPVMSGPCKGDRYRHYYETIDVSDRLILGKNVFAVQVLLCDHNAVASQNAERAPIFAVASLPGGHRLAVEGDVLNEDGQVIGCVTTGKASWKVYLDGSFYLKAGDEATLNLGAVKEEIDFRESPTNWKQCFFDDSYWVEPYNMGGVLPTAFESLVGWYGSHRLQEREIPLLFEKEASFNAETEIIFTDGQIVIPAFEKKELVLDAGEHSNAYLSYQFSNGKDAEVEITYCEKFFSRTGDEIKRTDSVHGELRGLTDKVILNGNTFVYEPFWYRTFRFIKILIQAGAEDVVLHIPMMRKTGYPLKPCAEISSDKPWVKNLWDICIKTLQNCMAETYMDCPFYEQMQFSMDTRLQMLFTYIVSNDVALARKALKDFHCSMIPDGLVQGKYPSGFPQIISTFSLHYVFMLEEFYRQTKEIETVKRYRSDIDTILEYFDRKIGYFGLVEHVGYWEFIDWQKQWTENMGVPTAAFRGPSTIINLMYAYALQSGAYVNEVTGRIGIAQEYQERRRKILKKVQEFCWDEKKGMYREGPDTEEYSQHAQAWAVLNQMVTKDEARAILRRTLNDSNVLQCSFSTGYEIFRAFEWAGDYGNTERLMQKWIRLIDLECTTCPEEPENGRSECHAWSALPIYEIMRGMAGIKMGQDGWETVLIQPHMDYVNVLKGKTMTPKGEIIFDFDKKNGKYLVNLPKNMRGKFVTETGTVVFLRDGINKL